MTMRSLVYHRKGFTCGFCGSVGTANYEVCVKVSLDMMEAEIKDLESALESARERLREIKSYLNKSG